MLMKDLLGNVSFRKSRMRFEQVVIAQSIPSVPIPTLLSDICRVFVIVGPGGGEFVRKPLPGGRAFVNSSRSG